MAGQTDFLEAVRELERIGETNGNQLSMEEIEVYFSDMKLEEKQLDFICNYFESHQISITNRVKKQETLEFEEEIETKKDPVDEEIVDIYLKEMNQSTSVGKEEENILAKKLSLGDENARNLLIESNLSFAVEVAKEYDGKGLLLSDLIQESNIGLMMAVNDYEPGLHGDFHPYAKKIMSEHLEAALDEYNSSTRSALKMASRINDLNDIATSFAKEYEREATPAELSDRMGITEDEVRELMKVSLDAIAVLDQGKMK